jgi:protein-disulfide isomerase
MNTLGNPDAPIVIEVYSSFACIHCKDFAMSTEIKLIENYVQNGQVYLIYRSFTGNPDDQYGISGQAVYCAGDQGKFWQMHDTIFSNFSATGYTKSQLTNFAKAIDLDEDSFTECLDNGKYSETILQDFQKGFDLGITGTPSFTINGEFVFAGNRDFEFFQQQIETALLSLNN